MAGVGLAFRHLPAIAVRLAASRLQAAGVSLEWDRAVLGPTGRLRVEALTMIVTRPGRRIVLEVPEAEAKLGVGWRRFIVEEALVRRPHFAMEGVGEAERESEAPRLDLPISIGRLVVEEGVISVDGRPSQEFSVEVSRVAGSAGDAPGGWRLAADAGPSRLVLPNRIFEVASIRAEGILEPTGVRVQRADLSSAGSDLSAHGWVGLDGMLLLEARGDLAMVEIVGPGADWLAGRSRVDVLVSRSDGGSVAVEGEIWPEAVSALGFAIEEGATGRVALGEAGLALGLEGERDSADLAVAFDPGWYGVRLQTQRSVSEVERALAVTLPIAGEFFTVGSVEGSGREFDLRLDLRTENLRLLDVDLGPGSGRLEATAGEVRVDWTGSGDVRFEAAVDAALEEKRTTVRIDEVSTTVAWVASVLGAPLPAAGRITGSGRVDVRGEEVGFEARLRCPDLEVDSHRAGPVTIALSGDPTHVDATVTSPLVDGELGWEVEPGRGEVRLTRARIPYDLAATLLLEAERSPWRGTVDARGTLRVADAGRRVEGGLELELDSTEGPRGRLVVRDGLPVEGELRFGQSLQARLETTEEGTRWEATAEGLQDLAMLWEQGGALFDVTSPLPDRIEAGTVQAEGWIDRANLSRGELRFRAESVSGLVGPCPSVTGKLDYDLPRWEGEADLRCDEGRASAWASYHPASGLQTRGYARDVPLTPWEGASVRIAGSIEGVDDAIVGRGVVTLPGGRVEAEFEGRRAHVVITDFDLMGWARLGAEIPADWSDGLHLEGDVLLSPSEWLGLPEIVGRIREDGDTYTLGLQSADGEIRLNGAWDRDGTWSADVVLADLSVPQPPLPKWTDVLSLRSGWSWDLTGACRLSGRGAALGELDAEVARLRLVVDGEPVVRHGDGRFHWDPGSLRAAGRLEGPHLDLAGEIARGGVPTVNGRVELAVIDDLLVEAFGEGTALLSYEDAVFTARLEEGALQHPAVPLPIEELRGTVRVDGDGITVDSIKGISGDGAFLVDGRWGPSDHDLRLRSFPVALPARQRWLPGLQGSLGGLLRLQQDPSGALVLGGSLRFTDGSYRRDLDLSALAQNSRPALPRDGAVSGSMG